jgi:hypothetical protein
LTVPDRVTVNTGQEAVFRVTVGGEEFDGGAAVRFEGVPPGVFLNAISLERVPAEGTARVQAAERATHGDYNIRVIATCGQVNASAEFTLSVTSQTPPRP